MRLFIRWLLTALVGLVAVLLVNILRLPNHQLSPVPTALAVALPPDTALAHLVGALRIPAISRTTYAETGTVPFDQLQAYLGRTFPLVHERLKRQTVNRYGNERLRTAAYPDVIRFYTALIRICSSAGFEFANVGARTYALKTQAMASRKHL